MYTATYARSGRRAPLQPAAVQQLPCSSDPDLFFAETPEDVRRAKELCGACPIRLACLAGALERAEPHGVWGGALFLRGMITADKRARGRPRKSPASPPAEVPGRHAGGHGITRPGRSRTRLPQRELAPQ